MKLTIAECRNIAYKAACEPRFRAHLHTRPHAAIGDVIGCPLAAACTVEVFEEGDEWRFLLLVSDSVEIDLPNPVDARGEVENSAYALLRDNQPLREQARSDPLAFAREWLGAGLNTIKLHEVALGTLGVLVPSREAREVLDEEMLDTVAGGGQSGCNAPPATSVPCGDEYNGSSC